MENAKHLGGAFGSDKTEIIMHSTQQLSCISTDSNYSSKLSASGPPTQRTRLVGRIGSRVRDSASFHIDPIYFVHFRGPIFEKS